MTNDVPPYRRRPSSRKIAVRRAIASLVLVVGLLAAGWAALAGVRAVRDDPAPPATATTATQRPRPARPLRIVFPEGFTRRQMAERIVAVREIARNRRKVRARLAPKPYLAATRRHRLPGRFARDGVARPLEGFLFPATYEFTRRTTAKQLVARQLEAFGRAWATVDLRYARSKNLTPYDVLIIASLIEEETSAPAERRLVAAVVYNRLRKRMPLGIDATIRYGLDVPATEPLRRSQLESDNPYNSRRRIGLPPTPITNPGLASMRAAAHPARVGYLYFVRKPDKRSHFFTASEAEFLRKACEFGFGCS